MYAVLIIDILCVANLKNTLQLRMAIGDAVKA
jgi:hypothetical protein